MTRKIRVAHIITRLILGGAQENTVLSVEGLHQKSDEYEVILVSGPALGPEGELVERVRKSGVSLVLIAEMRRAINPILDVITFVKLYCWMKRWKPDIVHTHSSKAGILGRLAARLTGVKVIVHTIHGLPFHPYQDSAVNWLFILLECWATRWSDKIITVGEVMKEKALQARLGPAQKFQVIYSGMEVDKFRDHTVDVAQLRRQHRLEGRFVIGCLSRLAPLKGHEYLLEAFADLLRKYPHLHLLLIGDGTLRKPLEAQVAKMGFAQNVTFTGLVPSEDVPKLIQLVDILVHTSLREGLPRAVPQALIAGKPVVAFDIDGAREVVIPDITGYLVPPESASELASAIEKLISNPNKARQMGSEGQNRCSALFRKEKMVDDLDYLYTALMKTKS